MKAKRLLALVLALIMMAAIFAMPAAAAGTTCSCGGTGTAIGQQFIGPYSYITVGRCINSSATHTHTQNAHLVPYRCNRCSNMYNVFIAFANVTCPYGLL